MDAGEFLTRATIWITIVLYVAGVLVLVINKPQPRAHATVRVVWTLACISLILHFLFAFEFFHNWSHAAAYRDTARQTYQVVGFASGAGLIVNYVLLAIWVLDVGWWWLRGRDSYFKRPRLVILAWHWFLLFIIFNATVVFGKGLARWVGLLVSLILCLAWIMVTKQISSQKPDRQGGQFAK